MKYAFLALLLLQNPSPSRGVASQNQQGHSSGSQQESTSNQRGTETNPLFVKQLPTPKASEESAQETKDRDQKAANDRSIVNLTFWLVIATFVLAAVGIFQLFVFGYQSFKLRQTVDEMRNTGKQTDQMIQEAITQSKEAVRSSNAMENISTSIQQSTASAIASTKMFSERGQMQMRAYMCSAIGSGVYQDRAKGLKFQASVAMVNAGATPAHNVRFKTRADILPIPLPNNFAFPLPDEWGGGSLLGPHQQINVNPIVQDFCDDSEVDKIKTAQSKALYAWGIVEYRDVFGETHHTRFCQIYTFLPDKVWGYFTPQHNDAD